MASDAVDFDDADVVVGCHMSVVRVVLRKALAGRLPYIYTPIYEGGERSPGVLAIGETPPRQARPAIAWLAEKKRAQRWYLIGSDYVWPWLSHRAVKRYIAEAGGQVVGEDFVTLGEHDHSSHFERIKAARPDVVFISLIGLALLAPLSMVLAPYGVRLAHAISKRRLEIAFGLYLLLVSARFLINLL